MEGDQRFTELAARLKTVKVDDTPIEGAAPASTQLRRSGLSTDSQWEDCNTSVGWGLDSPSPPLTEPWGSGSQLVEYPISHSGSLSSWSSSEGSTFREGSSSGSSTDAAQIIHDLAAPDTVLPPIACSQPSPRLWPAASAAASTSRLPFPLRISAMAPESSPNQHPAIGLEVPGSPEGSCFSTSSEDESSGNQLGKSAGVLDSVELGEVIGRGAFGSVYRTIWRGQPAAVKVIEHDEGIMTDSPHSDVLHSWPEDSSGAHPSASTSALLEAAMSSALSHPNIVQTYDYHTIEPTSSSTLQRQEKARTHRETRIVMEYCDAGSLEDVIAEGRFRLDDGLAGHAGVDMEALCCTLLEIASALEYLHTMQITHRDLKPKNILLKSCLDDSRGFTAKVSDFGLSRLLPDVSPRCTEASTPDFTGTVTHMAPELLSEGRVSRAADVYSYGILMWEVLTGQPPYHQMSKVQIMMGVVSDDMRPTFAADCPTWYCDLASRCWAADPACRPKFAEVCHALHQQLTSKLADQSGSP